MKKSNLIVATAISTALLTSNGYAHNNHNGHIQAPISPAVIAEFDIVHAKVTTQGSHLIFQQAVTGKAGNKHPEKNGLLAGAEVYSYVWPTSLNSSAVGFEADQGILSKYANLHNRMVTATGLLSVVEHTSPGGRYRYIDPVFKLKTLEKL